MLWLCQHEVLYDELSTVFGQTSAEARAELEQLAFDMDKDSARMHMVAFENLICDIKEVVPLSNYQKARRSCGTLVNPDLRSYMADFVAVLVLGVPEQCDRFKRIFFKYVEDDHKRNKKDTQSEQVQQEHGAHGQHQRSGGSGRGRGRGHSQNKRGGASP